MSIERGTKTLPNAIEGFRRVNEREDFAFIHDVLEIKYEMARNCNFSTVGDTFAEQPYAIGKSHYFAIQILSERNPLNFSCSTRLFVTGRYYQGANYSNFYKLL